MNKTAAEAATGGVDTAKILTEKGPVVTAVVLRCPPSSKEDNCKTNGTDDVVQVRLIEEIEIDTTPNKSKVTAILGGPSTFLGQYEDEGIILMCRKFPDDLENLPPYNTHQLQPPLRNANVRGDIVIMKVTEMKEEQSGDYNGDDDDNNVDVDHDKNISNESIEGKDVDYDCNEKINESKLEEKGKKLEAGSEKNNENKPKTNQLQTSDLKHDVGINGDDRNQTMIFPVSNNELFLNYTAAEYIKFAARTDIPEDEVEIRGDEQASVIEEDQEEEEIDETDKSAMLNLVMNEVLRQYREENGRGPNTQELLNLRANIAKELDVEIVQELDGDWDKKANDKVPSAKKIAFDPKRDTIKEYVPDPNEYPSDNDSLTRALMGDYDGDNDVDDDDDDDDDDEDYTEESPSKKLKFSD